ncbi:MAG: SCO family protein [Rufibacter sp.]
MSPKKALVLGSLLLVPVLVFLFLKIFGVNRYSLRTYFPTSVDSTNVQGQWRYDTIYHKVPPFQLTSQTGASFSQRDLEGKMYVAHFFYTSCQGICKQVSTQLARVQDAFRFQPDVKIVSFSLQPEQDQVPVLQKYAQSFGAKPDRWIFLTGDKSKVYSLAEKGYFVPLSNTEGENQSLHQKQLLLVDKQQQIRGIYDGTQATEVDRLITEINVLLSEYETDHGNKD